MIPAGQLREYWAFISYSHQDKAWGDWLHKKLETYPIPKDLIDHTTPGGIPCPKRLYPIFRDREELPTATDLSIQIQEALKQSYFLIVICSPNSARSLWVNEEIKIFRRMGRDNRILALIVDGEPNASSKPNNVFDECFPEALRFKLGVNGELDTTQPNEPIAADARPDKDGKARALHKLCAGLLGVSFDDLYRRNERRQRRQLIMLAAITGSILLLVSSLAIISYRNYLVAEQEKNLLADSFANWDFGQAVQLVLKKKPLDALAYLARAIRTNGNTNSVTLAASLLTHGFQLPLLSLKHEETVNSAFFSPNGRWILTTSSDHSVHVWDALTFKEMSSPIKDVFDLLFASFSDDGRVVLIFNSGHVKVWNPTTGNVVNIKMIFNYPFNSARPIAAKLSSDGSQVVTVMTEGILVSDAVSGEIISDLDPLFRDILSATFSADNRKVMLRSLSHVMILDLTTSKVLTLLEVEGTPLADFSRDGSEIVTSTINTNTYQTDIQIWDTTTGRFVSAIQPEFSVNSVKFSPNGRWVLVAASDNTARILDAKSGQLIVQMQHASPVKYAEFSPDGRRIMTVSDDKIIQIWDVMSGQPFSGPMVHTDQVKSATFSPDGRYILTTGSHNFVRIWEVVGVSKPNYTEHSVRVSEFSPDGRWILKSSDKAAQVLDAVTSQPISLPMQHESLIYNAQFSPDGRLVLTNTAHTARVWDTASGHLISLPMRTEYVITETKFSPDGRKLLTFSDAGDFLFNIWDAASGQPISHNLQENDDFLKAVAFSVDGKSVITASKNDLAHWWDTNSGKPILGMMQHESSIKFAKFSPDGHWVLSASQDNARVWNAATGQPVSAPMVHSYIESGEFSPAGNLVLTIGGDNTARVWETTTGQLISASIHHENPINTAKFSPDGHWVVTASADHTARIWDARTGQAISAPIRHQDEVLSAQFSPDGHQVFTTSKNQGAPQIWDAPSGQPVSTLGPKQQTPIQRTCAVKSDAPLLFADGGLKSGLVNIRGGISDQSIPIGIENSFYDFCAFNFDGNKLLLGSLLNGVQLWDANTGQSISKIIKGGVLSASADLSPDGHLIVLDSEDYVRVLDSTSGQLLSTLLHHAKPGDMVSSVKFSPDGRLVIISLEDQSKSKRIWNAATGQPITTLQKHHKAKINTIVFSQDGRRALTASSDQTVCVWDSVNWNLMSACIPQQSIVTAADFSKDGQRIVIAYDDGTVKVWNTVSGLPVQAPFKYKQGAVFVKFSPDARRVVSFSNEDHVRVWDVANVNVQPLSIPMSNLNDAVFSADNQKLYLIPEHGYPQEWNIATGQEISNLYHTEVHSSVFSKDKRRVLTISHDFAGASYFARVWDVSTGQPISSSMQHNEYLKSAEFSPDERQVLTVSKDKTQVWDANSGQLLSTIGPFASILSSAEFSPDGHWVLTCSADAQIWETLTGNFVSKLMKNSDSDTDFCESAHFSPDGKSVVLSSRNKASIREASSGMPVSEPKLQEPHLASASFNQKLGLLISVNEANSVGIWDSVTGKLISKKVPGELVKSARFSLDGKRVLIITRTGGAQIWDTKTTVLISVIAHDQPLYYAELSPDGRRVVTIGDNTRIWDVDTGQLVLAPIEGNIRSAKFSPDGERLLTSDGRIWALQPQTTGSSDFATILEQISGCKLTSNKGLDCSVPPKGLAELKTVIKQSADLKAEERRILDWLVDDARERTVMPERSLPIKEMVQQLIQNGTVQSLNEALDLWPGHPLALAKLGLLEMDRPADEEGSVPENAKLWTDLAIRYDPNNLEIKKLAETTRLKLANIK